MKPKSADFNSYIEVIDQEIKKRKYKWNLTSLAWLDFDDVSQIIRLHIFNKWSQYDQSKPIQPWLNRIISHQISNLIRNLHTNVARPCLRCDASKSQDTDGCRIYGKQCNDCPLFADWTKRKQSAYNIKIPVSIEHHVNEVSMISDNETEMTSKINQIHEKMKEILKPIEYQVYEGLYILHEDEDKVAKKIGYISNENGRNPGYKQIKNIKKTILEKFKKCMEKGEIDA